MNTGNGPGCFAGILRDPGAVASGCLNGAGYTARVAIPDYRERVARHYSCDPGSLSPPFEFPQFGIIVEFATPTEIALHGADMHLDESVRTVLGRYGAVSLRNAYLPPQDRSSSQRNVFSSLRFHVDRGDTQQDYVSMFWRDPFDPVQRIPRTSSTLILPNAVAYLQARAEGQANGEFKPHYSLFEQTDLRPLIGDTLLELAWDAPEGTGDISTIAGFCTRATTKAWDKRAIRFRSAICFDPPTGGRVHLRPSAPAMSGGRI